MIVPKGMKISIPGHRKMFLSGMDIPEKLLSKSQKEKMSKMASKLEKKPVSGKTEGKDDKKGK